MRRGGGVGLSREWAAGPGAGAGLPDLPGGALTLPALLGAAWPWSPGRQSRLHPPALHALHGRVGNTAGSGPCTWALQQGNRRVWGSGEKGGCCSAPLNCRPGEALEGSQWCGASLPVARTPSSLGGKGSRAWTLCLSRQALQHPQLRLSPGRPDHFAFLDSPVVEIVADLSQGSPCHPWAHTLGHLPRFQG